MKGGRKGGPDAPESPDSGTAYPVPPLPSQRNAAVKGVLPKGREELSAILENMDAVFYRNDSTGNILMVSAGVAGLLGYRPDELIGTPAADLYATPEDREKFIQAIHDGGGLVRDYRITMRHRDGHLVYLSNSAHIFPIPGQAEPGIEGMVRDVTREHQARVALAREKDRHQRLVQGLADGVFILSHGDIRFANRAGAHILGVDDAHDLTGRPFLDFMAPERREFIAAWMDRAMAGGGASDKSFRLREEQLASVAGTRIIANLYAHPITDPEGNGSLQLVVRDVTERKAEESLLHLSSRVFLDSPDIISVIGHDFRYRMVNRAYVDFYGIPEAEIVNSKVSDLMGAEKFNSGVQENMELCLSGERVHYEDWFVSPVLGRRYMHVAYTPLESALGRIDGLIVVARDITERKQAEDKLRTLNEELEMRVQSRTLTLESEITQRQAFERRLRDSEERFRAIAELTSAAIFLSSAETGQIYYANPAAARLFGYDEGELLRVNGVDLYADPADRARTLKAITPDGGAHFRQERYKRRDGSQFWGARSVVRSTISGADTLVTVLNDISELKTKNEELRISEERFRDIVETATDWFWETDADLRFTLAPRQFIDTLGLPEDQVLNKTRLELVGLDANELAGPEGEKWRAHMDDLESRRPFQNFEYEISTPNSGMRVFRVSGKPFFDKDGGFLGYRGSTTDVTEQKKNEDRIKEARDDAERANAAKSEFLAAVSHELRTPLNAIIGFSEMMTKEILGPLGNESYGDYAQNIFDSGERLLSIINDILDISAIESGSVTLREDAISPSQMADNLYRDLSKIAGREGVSLVVTLASDTPSLVGDERRLEQALRNVLINAIKFTPRGGRATLTAVRVPSGRFEFRVADTGIGMTESDIKKAMKPFSQVDGAIHRKYEGAGLGLTLTKRLVDAHDGTIVIESRPGKGTTVIISLPPERVVAP